MPTVIIVSRTKRLLSRDFIPLQAGMIISSYDISELERF